MLYRSRDTEVLRTRLFVFGTIDEISGPPERTLGWARYTALRELYKASRKLELTTMGDRVVRVRSTMAVVER